MLRKREGRTLKSRTPLRIGINTALEFAPKANLHNSRGQEGGGGNPGGRESQKRCVRLHSQRAVALVTSTAYGGPQKPDPLLGENGILYILNIEDP